MGIFENGYCKSNECKQGKQNKWKWDEKDRSLDMTDELEECPDCKGTELNLSSMGEELVEFLRQVKGKI